MGQRLFQIKIESIILIDQRLSIVQKNLAKNVHFFCDQKKGYILLIPIILYFYIIKKASYE